MQAHQHQRKSIQPNLIFDLQSQFSELDWKRGKSIQNKVLDLKAEDFSNDEISPYKRQLWSISASVQGSRSQPYQVELSVELAAKAGWTCASSCTCPIEKNCKHAVAVLFQWLQPVELSATPVDSKGKLQDWIAELKQTLLQSQSPAEAPVPLHGETRLYLQACLHQEANGFADFCVRPLLAVLDDARLHIQAELSPFRLLANHASLLTGIDAAALKELAFFDVEPINGRHWYPLVGARGLAVLEDALQWERLVFTGAMGKLLSRGETRDVQLRFVADASASQHLAALCSQDESEPVELPLLRTEPLTYFDKHSATIGRLRLPVSINALRTAMNLAPMSPEKLLARKAYLHELLGNALPAAIEFNEFADAEFEPVPVLRLLLSADKEALLNRKVKRRIGYARQLVDLGFETVPVTQYLRGVQRIAGQKLLRYPPSMELVELWQTQLRTVALERVQDRLGLGHVDGDWLINADYDEQTLSEFCFIGVTKLKALGWRIEYSPGFPLKLIDQQSVVIIEATEAEGGRYFDLALDIEVGGQKVPLLPILKASVEQGRYNSLPDNPDAIVPLYLPDGPVPIAAGRLRLMLSVLAELGSLSKPRLPRMRAALINELDRVLAEQMRYRGSESIRSLSERLANVDGLKEIEASASLKATLRPYQKLGLGWLKFLRETELAGILADDMGLGKTVQVLAHVLLERESNGAQAPVLVVAPTSVLPNWRAEIERFAPSLKTLTLSGSKRAQRTHEIANFDIVLTSYVLLGRDIEKLIQHEFDLLVLDEAQLVKNPNTLAAKAARRIPAKHRLCLTGTPLENHLGELWTQFDFLMPGFLGTRMGFQKNFRTPIEKKRDRDVSQRLRQRIAPFLLRRTKDQVIHELPSKSIIVKRVELEGKQRDLYETTRLSLKAQMQALIQERGAEKGRISLLDALLKLRQICCDPRLLKLTTTALVPSAKFEHLFDMLTALIAEGRRVLLFSQFTSMLALIEAECLRRKIKFVQLTGQSDDRETPVRKFQTGEVPLFLISLRAGGVGLNLTAADTVIHYDPWWNPAVEEQATDRAYRIGQMKPVFVYRLITAGTIEERIEEMKLRKRELANMMLDDNTASAFSHEELMALLDG